MAVIIEPMREWRRELFLLFWGVFLLCHVGLIGMGVYLSSNSDLYDVSETQGQASQVTFLMIAAIILILAGLASRWIASVLVQLERRLIKIDSSDPKVLSESLTIRQLGYLLGLVLPLVAQMVCFVSFYTEGRSDFSTGVMVAAVLTSLFLFPRGTYHNHII